ncbi:MAG: DUF1926 domain-containing protein [Sulfuricurvum sp.]|uniref:alpha-amylase/4-alpha-glucanotransferase domain-containing protein n=1 Tax=Sulfuricurvum sp. TaxID=2025608 RepID=UPI0025D32032|nr:alpha-amylase/4-alpha-glucanotransferase domain-containing protein [Sulfuricurvum sp.]MCK9372336.1 DUF1926 domain-containing protein [Sulfuricurvum sp.]
MGITHFLFGIHCHQPVDNFHEVVDDAIAKSYRPFFEVASRYESFRFSVHFSGWLLEFIQTRDPELFSLMQEMARGGRIEFFSGGFYEPILSAIPRKERIDQVNKLNTYIQKYFDQTPRGLWLTERVWDSSLVGDMRECGIEYMVVDDYHFISTGFDAENLYGYYLTENGGETMALFPINKTLRYLIPFKGAQGVKEYLSALSATEDRAAVLFDDGEKFGAWPKTYEWVYESGWLEQFLAGLAGAPEVLSSTYSDYFDSHKPLGLAYLPPYSYFEMGEWSLTPHDAIMLEKIKGSLSEYSEESVSKFVKGSIWKNFLVKYYESNHIHKRSLELSAVRNEVNNSDFDEWLFKAQTNDALWHGVFGGLYLPNLRDNAYRFIIEAENIRYKERESILEINDFNMDGYDDVKFIGNRYIALFDSRIGGQMNEFGLRETCFNLQNTLKRYVEPYHEAIMNPNIRGEEEVNEGITTIHALSTEKMEGLKELLIADWYHKNSFIDHISDESFDENRFKECSFPEYGDFVNTPFTLKKGEKIFTAVFERRGGVYADGVKYSATLTKHYRFTDEGIGFEISLESEYTGSLMYCMEMNFHFAELHKVNFNGIGIENGCITLAGDTLEIDDPYTATTVTITVREGEKIILSQIDTVSQSEIGFDLTNQGVSIAFVVPYQKSFNVTGSMTLKTKG